MSKPPKVWLPTELQRKRNALRGVMFSFWHRENRWGRIEAGRTQYQRMDIEPNRKRWHLRWGCEGQSARQKFADEIWGP